MLPLLENFAKFDLIWYPCELQKEKEKEGGGEVGFISNLVEVTYTTGGRCILKNGQLFLLHDLQPLPPGRRLLM